MQTPLQCPQFYSGRFTFLLLQHALGAYATRELLVEVAGSWGGHVFWSIHIHRMIHLLFLLIAWCMNRGHEVVVVVVDLCHSSLSLFPRDCRNEVKLSETRHIPSHEAVEDAIVNLTELILHFVT